MKRYIALLRGVNVSGKNKIVMAELKAATAAMGFAEVKTLLNSGNLIFSAEETNTSSLAGLIREMILKEFQLDIPVLVIGQEELGRLLEEAPDWWGSEDKDIYDNLILLMPDITARELADMIGEPTDGLEKVALAEKGIFWSFDRKKYQKANWWKKTAAAGIGEHITIRTAGTIRKLINL